MSGILTPTLDRRIRRYQFSIALLCDMFKTDNEINVRVTQGWPEDATIVGLHSDETSYSFTVLVESKEFEPVKENNMIPTGNIQFAATEDSDGKN